MEGALKLCGGKLRVWLEPGVGAECERSPGTVWKNVEEAQRLCRQRVWRGAQILCGRRVCMEPRDCMKGAHDCVDGAQRLH